MHTLCRNILTTNVHTLQNAFFYKVDTHSQTFINWKEHTLRNVLYINVHILDVWKLKMPACTLVWSAFEEKIGNCQVVRNCFMSPIPKFHILMLLLTWSRASETVVLLP